MKANLTIIECIILQNDISEKERDTYKNQILKKEILEKISLSSQDLTDGKYVETQRGIGCDTNWTKSVQFSHEQKTYLKVFLEEQAVSGKLHSAMVNLYEETQKEELE